MKKFILVIGMLLAAMQVQASPWTSLGRLNALTDTPHVPQCQQRIINHYWSDSPVYMPSNVQSYGSNNFTFAFNLDLFSLESLVSNSPTLSRFSTALNFYNSLAGPKSMSALIQTGQFTSVSIEVYYPNSSNLIVGNGWGIDRSELQYYELQESCPV